ncbi:sigma-70 family RNA polymerase sigma factor [Amorphus sp. 3PC139-8]|uniref:sigma-70 family RNA polymerase sigma factor n=1 Tax=Amorphus sp. 3PC139-8 TaxID=2735676 RepID=UPI00345CB433
MADDDPYADLVEAVAELRDRTAFIALYDHFAPRINAFLLRLGTDNGSAEELTQEVMVTLWRKAALFDRTKSSTATWLFRIARNRLIDLKRRDRSNRLDPEEPMLQPAPADAPDAFVDSRERDGLVRQALDTLPAEQLELVQLAFFKGLSHSEIADATGLPLGTVKSRIRLAFTRLRRLLDDAAPDDTT